MTMKAIRILLLAAVALASAEARAEFFVDIGLAATRIESRINANPVTIKTSDESVHLGIGGRRPIGERGDIGFRLELDPVDSGTLLGLRALDYRRHATPKFAYGVFAGAARLALATPAYGWYLGGGIQLTELTEHWDLGIDFRVGDKLARDNLLPGEARDRSPDNFHTVRTLSVYLSRRF